MKIIFKSLLVLLGLAFTQNIFAQAPVISSFSPSSGPAGTSVTITGSGFAASAANNIVFFGATMATVTAASTTSLTVTVPVGATYQPISVLNGVTALAGYSAKPFITTFTPNEGAITTADFNPRVTFPANGWSAGVVIVDLDGDGKPDLAIADYWNHTVMVLRNTSVSGSITAGSFAPAVTFAISSAPWAIAAGDLDGDGKPDLVVTDVNTNTISVLRNTSTVGSITAGSFAASVDFITSSRPNSVAIGDLDGDGKLDLAVACSVSNNISVLRNTSVKGSINSSSFAAHVDLASDSVFTVAIGDLDGDGKPDLVATNLFSNTISVWRNMATSGSISTGSFAAPVAFTTLRSPNYVAIGDLDGDSKPDIAVADSAGVSILRNTSTTGSISASSFAAHVDFTTTGVAPSCLAIGDMDGDGKPDIIVSGDGAAAILRNTSTPGSISAGSFATNVNFFTGPFSQFIAIADLDGDGKPDIVVPNSGNDILTRTVSVLHNNPFFPPSVQATNITFANTTTNSTTASWTNGSGLSRAVFIAEAPTGSPSPINNNTYAANTVFGSGGQIGSSGWYCVYDGVGITVNITGLSSGATYRAMVVEHNGTAGSEYYLTATSTGNPANVTTLTGGTVSIDSINLVTSSPTNAGTVQYTATFGTPVTGVTAANFALAATGSISGASITSVTGSGTTYTITANTGTGNGTLGLNLANATGLTPGIVTPLPFAGAAYTIDHLANGAPVIFSFSPSKGQIGTSVIITGTGFNVTPTNNIVFFGATMATVTAASTTSLTVTVPAGATYQPISVLNGSATLAGYSDKPFLTTFAPHKGTIDTSDFRPAVTFTTGKTCVTVVIGDMDGDGKPDLVIVNAADKTISVLRNTSVVGSITANSFAHKVDFAVGNAPGDLKIGDLDGDGKMDVAVLNGNDSTISVLRNTSTIGSISFAPRVTFATRSHPFGLAIGDMDGDGKADLIVLTSVWTDPDNENTYTNTVSILRNTGVKGSITSGSFAPGVPVYVVSRTDAETIAIGDIDGDGKPDIVASLYILNAVAVVRNTSTPGSINSVNSFAGPYNFPTSGLPTAVAIGDLDGDGKPDLAVACNNGPLSVLRNTSVSGTINNSSFASHVDFIADHGVGSLAISDLDGDGKPDIASVDFYSSPTNAVITVYHNTSTPGSINSGSFASDVNFKLGVDGADIAVGDIDGDGRPDLVATLYSEGQGNTVAVLQNAPFFPPTVQATNIVFSNTATNTTTASWTNGNGTARAVFISAASTGSPLPVNRTAYTANPVYGSGSQIASSGWFCIYNGTGNTVNVTGLSSGGIYRVMVIEYNGLSGNQNYLTTVATGNPANVTTLSGGPIAINSINLVTSSPTNAASVQYSVTFATSVTGLTTNNFILATTGGVSGAGITSLSGSGSSYIVTVNAGTGDGIIGLNLANTTGLTPGLITPLPFVGQACTIDRTPPTITISDPSLSSILSGAGTITYTVNYADPNFNSSSLTASNITLNSTGSAMGTISVSGSGTSYTVSISNITGSGSLGISIAAGTASDLAGNNALAAGPSATFLVTPALTNITISSGTLSPMFADITLEYTTFVPNATSVETVTPTTTDPNATVTVNGSSPSTPVNLVAGYNTITVNVTTLDGSATTAYTIQVYRAGAGPGGEAPDINYGNGSIVIASTQPFSITPTNTGGPVPKTNYGQVTTFAGSPAETAGYTNDTGTAAQFNWPQQMVSDASGNLYVADANNNAIRMITPAGVVTTFAGSLTGLSGLQDGTGTAASFSYPDGIAIDPFNNLFVADYSNNAIRRITPAGVVSTFYTNNTTFGPGGMCFDNAGNLIVAAQDASQVISITPSGVASIVAGSTAGYVNGPAASAQFSSLTDVKVDASGNIYVADFENNAIREITPAGMVSTVAGSNVSGNTPGFANGVGTAAIFNNSSGLVLGPQGVIYVADLYNNDIRRILPDGTVSLVAGSAAQAPGDADGIGTAAGFNLPDYMYIDGYGMGYVSELGGNRVREMVLTGYTLNGTLPAGLAFDATTGIISGTPITSFVPKTDTITAYNAFGYSTAIITISYSSVSAIATLSNLVPGSGALNPVFAGATTTYADTVSNLISSMTLTPTTTDSNATVTVNGIAVASGTASAAIPLAIGPNTITTVVTAQDGTTTDTYTVVVTRAASSVATLADLTVSQGTLAPAFSSGTTSYTVSVSNSTSTITVTPTFTDNNAVITVNGIAVMSGTASAAIPLAIGPNTITTVVTAQDGTTTDTYTVAVTRAASSVATLADLTVSQGTLTPVFASGTTAYTDSVANTVTSLTVTPTFTDNNASITVNGIAVASGTASADIPLNPGNNTITVLVTAQDGVTTNTYTVTVYRAENIASLDANNVLTPNGDGKNDFWVVKDIQLYPQNNVTVYDKGGRVVYAKRGYNNEWDGTLNGQPLVQGTYYYVVDLGPNLGKFKGFISILRN